MLPMWPLAHLKWSSGAQGLCPENSAGDEPAASSAGNEPAASPAGKSSLGRKRGAAAWGLWKTLLKQEFDVLS